MSLLFWSKGGLVNGRGARFVLFSSRKKFKFKFGYNFATKAKPSGQVKMYEREMKELRQRRWKISEQSFGQDRNVTKVFKLSLALG